jgi:hypothetical protein
LHFSRQVFWRESASLLPDRAFEIPAAMTQPEVLDQDIRALQEWLRTAWQQLGDPALTTFMRRELRNQMKQCSADLRAHLQRAEELQRQNPVHPSPTNFRQG